MFGLDESREVYKSTNFHHWRDAICDTFVDLDCHNNGDHRFEGWIDRQPFLESRFVRVGATDHSVSRDKSRIARAGTDFILLSIMLKGQGTIVQNSREAQLDVGDFAIYDTTLPYQFHLNAAFEQTVVRIQRDEFCKRVGDVHALTARAVSGCEGTGRIASQFIRELSSQIETVNPSSARPIHNTMLDLIASALSELNTGPNAPASEARNLLAQRILRFVEDRLSDDQLSCEYIARAHGISERYLRKLFENRERSLSEWIWHRRLEEARRSLVDRKLASWSITTIAFDNGFKDMGHFSRAFRSKYGVTPRDYRQSYKPCVAHS